MTNFPLSGTTPVTGNKPSVDQPTMTQNNASILGWSSVDHVGYNIDEGGLHNQVTFLPNQSAPSLNGGVGGLYTNFVSGLSQLFFQNASQNRQLTGDLLVSSGTNYGFQTPWGIKINFGSVTVAANSSSTITYAIPFTSVLSLQATTQSSNANNTCTVNNVNGSTGTIYKVGTGPEACFYFAIGV